MAYEKLRIKGWGGLTGGIFFALILLAACTPAPIVPAASSISPATPISSPDRPKPMGADRDAHGCIGSAGYAWCQKESACVRPWELAHDKGFAVESQAFEMYCGGSEK